MQEKIIQEDITKELQTSYLDYAMSVIVSRALPDVRDGLKPVHRRIIYSMYDCGFLHNKQYRKSARVVGDVIGKYHPHGDAAVYDALVRMAQDFSLRETLIDGQGNFGSMDGDPPAAMRYTESRLSKICHNLIEDLNCDTVDFKLNYDASEKEPVVLPSLLPNLLLNGSSGIAVGMATNIPPHNLGQIVDACCLYIDSTEVTIEELIDAIEGPDFPTKCYVSTKGLYSAYKTGKGIITIKGKAEVVDQKEKISIIITEIPYIVNKAKLVEKIADLMKEGKIDGISDIRDESNREGVRVVLDLKKDAIANFIIKQLYKFTPLQNTYGINMLALDKGIPKLMNLKEIISSFVNFRKEIIHRRTSFFLREAIKKCEILSGLFIAVNNIDLIISIIKKSKDSNSAKQSLMDLSFSLGLIGDFSDDLKFLKRNNKYFFTEIQVKSILDMRLNKLTHLEQDKIYQDLKKILQDIAEYKSILASTEKLMSILKQEILLLKEKFSTPRLSKISFDEFDTVDTEDLIPVEDMVATFTFKGYVKRVPLSSYRSQNRGGKGKMSLSMLEEDFITNIIVNNTHTSLLFFSNLGKVYRMKMYKLPMGSLNSKGKQLSSLLPFSTSEKITSILEVNDTADENMNIIFATASGNVRKNKLSEFNYIPSNGKIAMKLTEGDELVGVSICEDNDEMFLATLKGKSIRFSVESIRLFKSRNSNGVIGIRLEKGDKVISQTILSEGKYSMDYRKKYLTIPLQTRLKIINDSFTSKDRNYIEQNNIKDDFSFETICDMAKKESFIFSVTEKGYGKCTSCYEYRVVNRGGKGVVNIGISEKVGDVVCSFVISDKFDDDLIIITNAGKTIRISLKNIRITGRSTSGVILFKVKKYEKVVSVALIKDSIEETEQTEQTEQTDQ